MKKKRALVILAQGCEELEAVTTIDLLRRADVEVVAAGLDAQPIHASRGVHLVADMTLDEALKKEYDLVALPGGLPGADNLANDGRVMALLQAMAAEGKLVSAICAAPVVLAKAGVLSGKRATSYPGCLDKMDLADVEYTGAAVECDGNIITSRGPGTAMDFALSLIEALSGQEARDNVEKALVR